MKRIVTSALLVVCVFLLLPNGRSNAREEEQKKTPPLGWQKLEEGVQVLKLWESVGPKWPEIAVLRLSKEEYEKFYKEPVEYLNKLKVYPPEYPAKKIIPCGLVAPETAKSDFVVVLKHDITSTSRAMSSTPAIF